MKQKEFIKFKKFMIASLLDHNKHYERYSFLKDECPTCYEIYYKIPASQRKSIFTSLTEEDIENMLILMEKYAKLLAFT